MLKDMGQVEECGISPGRTNIWASFKKQCLPLEISKKGEKYLEPLCPMGHIYSGARIMKAI